MDLIGIHELKHNSILSKLYYLMLYICQIVQFYMLILLLMMLCYISLAMIKGLLQKFKFLPKFIFLLHFLKNSEKFSFYLGKAFHH